MIRKAIPAAAVMALAACSPATQPQAPTPSPPAVSSAAPAPEGFTRTALAGLPAEPYELTVTSVERQGEHALLRMEVIPKVDDENTSGQGAFSGITDDDFSRFYLMDTVGGKVYRPLLEKKDGKAYGTRREVFLYSDVRYPVEVYFPGLPEDLKEITVVAPGALGEFAGVPVGDSEPGPPPAPTGKDGDPVPGDVVRFPVEQPGGTPYVQIEDLRELVESPQRSTRHDGQTETIALRSDVLFAFDKATLTARARSVLDDVAEETRRRADPARPPVAIVGHTDGKGSDAYNLPLSVRRARAVQAYLEARLGSDYVYRASGRGAAEPVAPNDVDGRDNPDGRARNRRVEISYSIKQETPGSTGATTTTPGRGGIADSAFHEDDGEVVTSFEHRARNTTLTVDVHPFYRDGAYLVGVFDVTNTGSRDHNSAFTPFGSIMHRWSSTADFAQFTVVDPASKARYFGLRIGEEAYAEGRLLFLKPTMRNRVFVYYPAPPDAVTSVTLDAGDDGVHEEIPIR
ncbi:OmpA family protein [Nonomuraea sp. NPDC050663]|uniref:OmpA family protein n=1 Tax=Nonomuraea sp. NPDC050663 TaxID=3364370 RepID=UPI00379F24D6